MQRALTRLLDTLGLLAFATFLLSSLWMVYLWVVSMAGWLGGWGVALALVTAPLAAVLPFVQWGVEGAFPERTFWIWAAGVLGVALSMGRGLFPSTPEDDDGNPD